MAGAFPAGGAGHPQIDGPPRARPSAWWYLLAGLLPLVGALAAFLSMRSALDDVRRSQRDHTRQAVNERGLVTFDRPGSFTMYFFGPDHAFGGDVEELLTRIDIRFTEVATGEPVVLRPYESDVVTSQDGFRLAAIKTFRIDDPGDYHLEVRTSDFRRDEAGVAVGPSPYRALWRGVIAAAGALGAGAVAGLSTAIGIGVQRARCRWLRRTGVVAR